jgi:copper chaperone
MAQLPRPNENSVETPVRLSAERDLVYVVAGMTCDHCKVAVTEEVTQVAGVTSVGVDLETKLVRVRGTDVDEAAVVAAIDEAGYDAVAA